MPLAPTVTDAELDQIGAPFTEDERVRFSEPIGRTIPRIMGEWQVSDVDGAALLWVSQATWACMKSGQWTGLLPREQLLRASLILGIYADLRMLFTKEECARWPTRPNSAAEFGGRAPVASMVAGGISQMVETRLHLARAAQAPVW